MRPWPPLLLALALPACTVGPDYKRPAVAGEAGHWIAPSGGSPVDLTAWRALGDPLLSALIDRAMTANLDIREAEARLRRAPSQSRQLGRDDIAKVIHRLGDMVQVLGDAKPSRKAKLYASLGLFLVLYPAKNKVLVRHSAYQDLMGQRCVSEGGIEPFAYLLASHGERWLDLEAPGTQQVL